MGKRKTKVVVSSSDDDDDKTFSLRSKTTSNPKLKSRPSSVPRANSRRTATKKARLSDSRAVSCKESSGFDEIKLFCEDFDEGFNGFRMSTGSGRSNGKDLWVDKYKPGSLEELAVHKKKVEEVKMWFEKRLKRQKEELFNNVLVITGQAGVGKSATVHVIASHLRATVCEWNTPTPTIWQEHLHNSNLGVRYMSKLDEFENFVERTRKYGLIPSSFSGQSQASVILVIDDLPVANGRVAFEKLNKCLHLLVQSALVPTVILITDCGEADSSDNNPQSWEELQSSLQRAGACKVAFNPITVNSIKKTLSRICREEHLNVDGEQIDLIAKASGGDIRHAITTLQYFCMKPHPRLSLSSSNGTPTYSKERSDDMSCLDDRFSLPFGRDETLSLFHALGKFLHNKRETENSISFEQGGFLVKERFARLPVKMDAPEKVLCKAHGQARPVTDFLHENVLDFLSEEAIDDACVVTSYLSDADFLLASLSGMITRNYEAENVIQSAAASVAVRGVLFGNFHPLSSRWHTIRRPSLWQVEQSLRYNKLETVRQRCIGYDGMCLSDFSVVATEFKPALKWLGFRGSEGLESRNLSEKDIMLDDESVDGTSFEDKDDTSDDEIEDW
ncbi:cell cycle checkpoint protein RAD17 isoform X2 [Rhododendron vialii]|uniref:cell cycle checkpoint protein RAD17 isoform X2 n=1 Tax=Rhododendron vialii TaxID=182163 RepID=UPI00266041DB|nr:cell cycle checkpoint protein RAD17 isoform X2 [Rhododendron vialii]